MVEYINTQIPNASPYLRNRLLLLEKVFELSYGKYAYRVHLLDKAHRRFPTVITQRNGMLKDHHKEWEYLHLIALNEQLYASEKSTVNKDGMEHPVLKRIYAALDTPSIWDMDREAKLINEDNADFIVNNLLNTYGHNSLSSISSVFVGPKTTGLSPNQRIKKTAIRTR